MLHDGHQNSSRSHLWGYSHAILYARVPPPLFVCDDPLITLNIQFPYLSGNMKSSPDPVCGLTCLLWQICSLWIDGFILLCFVEANLPLASYLSCLCVSPSRKWGYFTLKIHRILSNSVNIKYQHAKILLAHGRYSTNVSSQLICCPSSTPTFYSTIVRII